MNPGDHIRRREPLPAGIPRPAFLVLEVYPDGRVLTDYGIVAAADYMVVVIPETLSDVQLAIAAANLVI